MINKKKSIIFTKNERDGYFRKSVEFASSDVTLKDDIKSSGSVERLSATLLKGVQDQLFSFARQKDIKNFAAQLFPIYSEEYKKSFIQNYIKKAKRVSSGKSEELIMEEAQKNYGIKNKNIDSLAEKKAWREVIQKNVTDEELSFIFDAPSIFEYAAIREVKKDRLYEDVKKVQNKFNNWTEKHFNVEKGVIEDREENGVLFPHSTYTHGSDPEIEITINKKMIHMILFLSGAFLQYHLDSYIAIGTPNATRLYELLIDYIEGNLFVSNKDLTFDYLQRKFNTDYKLFTSFIQQVITPSLAKINKELNTSITWEINKKKGRSIFSIKFVISPYDKKVLKGSRDENIEESELYSFEYYLTLLSLRGRKAQGGLRKLYEEIRAQLNRGEFDYFGGTREELMREHMENLADAEELESLVSEDAVLSDKYMYDANYLNIIDRKEIDFIGVTATESLEYVRNTYLVPMGILSPMLSLFDSHSDEKSKMAEILPLKFKLTERKTIVVEESNYDSLKNTLEPYLSSTERFVFDTPSHKKRFCEIMGIVEDISQEEPILEATVIENERVSPALSETFMALENLLKGFNSRSITKDRDKWIETVNKLVHNYEAIAVLNVVLYLASGSQGALFWLKNITTPLKFVKHFEQIEQIANIDKLAVVSKIKCDPEIQARIEIMKMHGENEENIEKEVSAMIEGKLASGEYGNPRMEAPWVTAKKAKRSEGEGFQEALRAAGYNNIFDYIGKT